VRSVRPIGKAEVVQAGDAVHGVVDAFVPEPAATQDLPTALANTIRFRSKDTCEVNVKRDTEYPDFEPLLDRA
jgi:hypothetical protein